MSEKEVLLTNADYPDFCCCHVRDPKVWKEDGKYHMVLGARTKTDEGCVLFYESDDLKTGAMPVMTPCRISPICGNVPTVSGWTATAT